MTAAHGLRAVAALVERELLRSLRQPGRLFAALLRPLLWLAVFAAGFRNVFGIAIVEPYDTYVPYETYIAPGLVGMVLLFNGMQSSLALVVDRELGVLRALLAAPLPRPLLLGAKLLAAAVQSLLQAVAFVVVALMLGTELPLQWTRLLHVGIAAFTAALMLAALGLVLTVHVRQLENFAGTMNFVVFPMYFLSTALYPLWKLEESGARWVFELARLNPFTHAVEWLRFAWYDKDPGLAPVVVIVTGLVCFAIACIGYDPQRGFAPARRAA